MDWRMVAPGASARSTPVAPMTSVNNVKTRCMDSEPWTFTDDESAGLIRPAVFSAATYQLRRSRWRARARHSARAVRTHSWSMTR